MKSKCPWRIEKLKPMSYSKLTVGCKGSNYPCVEETCAPYFWFKNVFNSQKTFERRTK